MGKMRMRNMGKEDVFMNEDSIRLLKECNSGTKTAINSFDAVLDKVHDPSLQDLLRGSRQAHEDIGNETHRLLQSAHGEDKDPAAIARAGARFKINMELLMDPSDNTIADLMTDGCNMGIKQISVCFNKYPNADQAVKALADRMRSQEDALLQKARVYL